MKYTKIFAIISLALIAFAGCDKDYHEVYAPDELGLPESEFYAEATGDDLDIMFLANKQGTFTLLDEKDASWVKLGSTSFESDGNLIVNILSNDGFKRRADILLATDTRKDTISIFQHGAIEEKFNISAGSMIVYNGTDEIQTVPADINVLLSKIKTEVRYSGDEKWIQDCNLSSSKFSFKTTDNADEDYTRRAMIVLSYRDGWEQMQTASIVVIQARADNNIGKLYTAEELRAVATTDGYTLPEEALIEGYIVSTTEGGNAGDQVVADIFQGTGVIDYTLTERTSYLMSTDGSYGFRLISDAAEKNEFKRYSRVCLNIAGAKVFHSEDTPVQYTIEGITSENILTSADGEISMPKKVKSIDELTDDDINTLVTIKDCEIAMRKGPFTPINEGYSSLCGYNRVAKYPILIRDIMGGSMYMYTNMTCTYRRNGETLPYGSGNITGVVVHEDYTNFEKDGNIGRYQLRHMTREDIDLKPNFEDNFSGIITEFRYAKFPNSEFDETKLPNAILATKGNGEMCHTYGSVSNFSPTYFYIGQCGSKKKGKYEEGAGIELEEGGIYQPWVDNNTEGAQNTDGKGWFKNSLMISWSNKYWWDGTNSRGYCWLVNFSTEGITSDKVSMQFAMYNNSQSARSPRYWKAQYSLTTTDCSKSSDSQWKDIAEFTVPDVAIWDYQNDWQTLGTRVYDFPLPTEILGKESVSIRLMPRNNKAAKKDKTSYDNSTIANNSGYNTMDYFAVRYNK